MRSSTTTKAQNPTKFPRIVQKNSRPLIEIQNKAILPKLPRQTCVKQIPKPSIKPQITIISKPSSKSSIKSSNSSSYQKPSPPLKKYKIAIISKPSSKSSDKSSQNDIKTIKKEPISFPKVSWDDFQGPPGENTWFLAEIYWYVSYDLKVLETTNKFKIEVVANCQINKARSWVKSKYDELLEHEQGHYNIGYLCALMFQKRVKMTRFMRNNYQEDVRRMFNDTMREYCQMEKEYDEETNHMIDGEMQVKWNEDLIQKLKEFNESF